VSAILCPSRKAHWLISWLSRVVVEVASSKVAVVVLVVIENLLPKHLQ
jgi:hypothetical protein